MSAPRRLAIFGRPMAWAEVTDRVTAVPLGPPPRPWIFAFGAASALTVVMLTAIAWLLIRGVGVWGIHIPVAWGFAITNFVWWIGIGHAGTLISAILLLLRQEWRTSINRFTEAMTLFAVANAGLFPLLHLGRFWKFYYLFPYPSTLEVWPQWRSPLTWDVIAVLTYATVSLIFWYVGLVPDLAALRDRARRRWIRVVAGLASLGWRGSARHWQRHGMAYLIMAGLATPLVVSVHSIVSLDFSVGIVPGWHSTIFPPYFVAGAIYSGFAMVFTITVPLRRLFGLEDLITLRHFDAAAKITLASGLIVAYGYVMEYFTAFYSGDTYELAIQINRVLGDYWPTFALMMLGNVIAPQLLWFRKVRTSPLALFLLSIVINVGMWVERYVIVATSLHRDFLPSAWKIYHGTIWDWLLLAGTLGFFTFLMLLFVKLVPMISAHEVQELLHDTGCARPSEDRPEERIDPTVIPDAELHGTIAEFDRPEPLLEAARRVRAAGFTRLDTYTPWPVEGLVEALGLRRTRVPLVMLLGGLAAGLGAFFLLAWSQSVDYPWNVGGRPLFSWPSYIPITFESTVLGAVLAGFAAFLVLNRLPQAYHPVFNAPGFDRATRDRFFLCIEAEDPRFDRDEVRELLAGGEAIRVAEVPR